VSAYPAFFLCNQPGAWCQGGQRIEEERTLDTDVNVAALVRLLYLSGVFIGFGEGVCERHASQRVLVKCGGVGRRFKSLSRLADMTKAQRKHHHMCCE
jgi:hypothetical protein